MIDRKDPKLAQEIQRVRRELGFSQKQFAAKMGVSSGAVYNWEAGNTRMRKASYERFTQLAGGEVGSEKAGKSSSRSLVPTMSTQVNTDLNHLTIDDLIRGIVNGVKELRKRGYKTEFSVTV